MVQTTSRLSFCLQEEVSSLTIPNTTAPLQACNANIFSYHWEGCLIHQFMDMRMSVSSGMNSSFLHTHPTRFILQRNLTVDTAGFIHRLYKVIKTDFIGIT